jgi:hypothetical protein
MQNAELSTRSSTDTAFLTRLGRPTADKGMTALRFEDFRANRMFEQMATLVLAGRLEHH